MDKVVHFEIPVDDTERARTFYGSVFEWGLQPMEGFDYTLVETTAVDEDTRAPTEPGAINGGMMKRGPDTPSPVITINVGSIDDALREIESSGGSVVRPKSEIPGMGAFAYFKDTEGNIVGALEPAAS